MSHVANDSLSKQYLWAGVFGVLSGLVSALTLNPVGEFSSTANFWPSEIIGFVAVFAASAGIAFGVIGAGFGLWRKGFRATHALLFLGLSVLGVSAASYAAFYLYAVLNSQVENFILPFLAASPIGALIVMVPLMFAAGFRDRKCLAARAVWWPTLWSVGVAVVMLIVGAADALEVRWLLPLFIGWQVLFLGVLAGAERKA